MRALRYLLSVFTGIAAYGEDLRVPLETLILYGERCQVPSMVSFFREYDPGQIDRLHRQLSMFTVFAAYGEDFQVPIELLLLYGERCQVPSW